MKGWIEAGGDRNWEEYGATWAKVDPKRPSRVWFVEFVNMEEACGKDFGAHRYVAEVSVVDMAEMTAEMTESALKSASPWGSLAEMCEEYGPNRMADMRMALAEAHFSYGHKAPMGTHCDNSYPLRVRAAARREAETYMADSAATEEALNRPVNALGSSAREYARGDINAAMYRGTDPLAYVMGYIAGLDGDEKDEDAAEAYNAGRERGYRVYLGQEPPWDAVKRATKEP